VGLFIVAAWIAIQVAGEAFEAWGVAEQALRYVWIAAALGFPLAIVFGWRYDITAGRIVRTHAADPTKPTDLSLQRVDYVILTVLLFVVTTIGYGVVRQAGEAPDAGFDDDATDIKSIAVLPFENLSGDEAAVPFTAGIHDDILTQISKISDLRVISRSSVARLEPTMSIREIGSLLKVATVLAGGVQRAGDQLRINVQLIDIDSDDHLWAETFDRELSTRNIFAIQTEIAQAVASALQATLSSREQQSLTQIPTDNFAAYEAYLIGKQKMALRTIPFLEQARDSFSTAVALDEDFALAHVGLADTVLLLNNYGALPLDEAVAQADSLLGRALELDPGLGAAHASVGLSLTRQGREEEAQSAYERAIALDPNYAPAYHWYGDVMMNVWGDFDKALSLIEQARVLDPLSPVINVTLGQINGGLGRFDDALAQYEKTLSLEPDYAGAYFEIAILQRSAFGRIDEGIRWHVEELKRDPIRPGTGIAFAYLDLGDDKRAEQWVDWALARQPDWFWPIAAKAQLHQYRGEADDAIRYAEQLNRIAPGNNFSLYTLVSFGHDERALEIFAESFPDFSCDPPEIDRSRVFHAINVSLALERAGETDCANRMLDAAQSIISEMPRLGGFGYGIADVEIYARQGRKELALETLREAVDSGWRSAWWLQGLRSPHNANIADDPRFISMMDEVRADLALQLENVRRMEANGNLDLPAQ